MKCSLGTSSAEGGWYFVEVFRIEYRFYTCFLSRVVIEAFTVDYGLYTCVVNRVVTNLTVFCFPRKLLGGVRTDFRTLGSPRIGRS